MSDSARPRWPAYICTVLIAGLGHWYLGKWRRGIAWFFLYALALAFLSARTITGAVQPGDPFVVTALQLESVAYTDVAVPLAVLFVCLLDLYLSGLAKSASSSEPMDENPSNR